MFPKDTRSARRQSPDPADFVRWTEGQVCCHAVASNGGGPASAPAVRILLVDDHEDTNRSLMLLLTRRGYKVETATSLAAAEVACGLQVFDVLLCDMNLPDGSGLDLLGRLRERAPRFGAIMVSGYSMDEDIDRSLVAGYQAHLSKPVALDKLDAAIRRLLP